MSISETMNAARLRAAVWWRERKEKAEAKKAAKAMAPPRNGAPLLWVWFLAIIAAATLIGSTWMLVVFIAGSVGSVDWAVDWRAGNDGEPARWIWFAQANIHLIIGVGLFCFCLGIACFNAVWLHVRHYLRGVFMHIVTGLGIATALFMVAGAIVTQQWGTDARTRDQVEAVNTSLAGVAAVNAEIAAIEREMERLCAPALTTYQAQACRSGEVAWQGRIAIARGQRDYQLPGIERAIVDAQQGDRWRARLLELRQQAAVASVDHVEAAAATVVTQGWMATFARVLEDIRKPFIAVLGELLAMTMFGVSLAAWRSRQPQRDVETSGWADEAHRIEDKTAEEPIATQPMKPPREVVTDAETGEELIKITPRPHWRKRKGQPNKIDVQPDIPPDEAGVKDGAQPGFPHGRTGLTVAGPMTVPEAADDVGKSASNPIHSADDDGREQNAEKHQGEDNIQDAQPEPPELSDEEAIALASELPVEPLDAPGTEQSVVQDDHGKTNAEDDGETNDPDTESGDQNGADEIQTEPPSEAGRSPETNPAKLIAAE